MVQFTAIASLGLILFSTGALSSPAVTSFSVQDPATVPTSTSTTETSPTMTDSQGNGTSPTAALKHSGPGKNDLPGGNATPNGYGVSVANVSAATASQYGPSNVGNLGEDCSADFQNSEVVCGEYLTLPLSTDVWRAGAQRACAAWFGSGAKDVLPGLQYTYQLSGVAAYMSFTYAGCPVCDPEDGPPQLDEWSCLDGFESLIDDASSQCGGKEARNQCGPDTAVQFHFMAPVGGA